MKKETRGGKRKGAGNPGTPRVAEHRERVTLSVLPSIFTQFKKKYGRGWSRRVEELMKKDESFNKSSHF